MKNPKFLVKPLLEGKSLPCDLYHFDLTRKMSRRVQKLDGMRLGCEPHTRAEYFELLGQQPIFYLQECYAPEGIGYDWNGLLLYSVQGHIQDTRKVAKLVKDELHIVMAWHDPHFDRYFILIDSQTGGGSDADFRQWSRDIYHTQVSRYFHQAVSHGKAFYCNALLPEYYDVVDTEALFGEEAEEDVTELHDTTPDSSPRSIKAILTNLFKF